MGLLGNLGRSGGFMVLQNPLLACGCHRRHSFNDGSRLHPLL